MGRFRDGCVVCGGGRSVLCDACWRSVEAAPSTTVRGVGPVVALFAYAGHGARIVQHLKFRDGRRLVTPLADELAAEVSVRLPAPAAVTWVPTSGPRRRERGFDQAELLSRALARRLRVPVIGALRRRRGLQQTGLDRRSRELRAADAFSVRPTLAAAPRSVLLVDDVCTTGASLRAATEALRTWGVVEVHAAVVARTP